MHFYIPGIVCQNFKWLNTKALSGRLKLFIKNSTAKMKIAKLSFSFCLQVQISLYMLNSWENSHSTKTHYQCNSCIILFLSTYKTAFIVNNGSLISINNECLSFVNFHTGLVTFSPNGRNLKIIHYKFPPFIVSGIIVP